jgi:hypothetical protein
MMKYLCLLPLLFIGCASTDNAMRSPFYGQTYIVSLYPDQYDIKGDTINLHDSPVDHSGPTIP